MHRLLLILSGGLALAGCERQSHLPSLPTPPDASTGEATADAGPPTGPVTFVLENGMSQPMFIHGARGIVEITQHGSAIRRDRVNRLCDCAKNCSPLPPPSSMPTRLDVGGKVEYVWPAEIWKVRALDERDSCEYGEPAEPAGWAVTFCWAGQSLEGPTASALDNPVCKTVPFELGGSVRVVIDEAPPEPVIAAEPDVAAVAKRVADCAITHPPPGNRNSVEVLTTFDHVGGWLAHVSDKKLEGSDFATCVQVPWIPVEMKKTAPEHQTRTFQLRPGK